MSFLSNLFSRDKSNVVDLTRFLSKYQSSENNTDDESAINQDKFFGVHGSARLIATNSGDVKGVHVQLNGAEVVGTGNYSAAGKFEVPVTLVKDNVVSVTVNGAPESSVTIRVKQEADIKLHFKARLHFNTNVSNYEAASEFYGKIGFGTLMGFPGTNTQAMARAIGIQEPTSYDGSQGGEAGGYLLGGELKCLSPLTWGGDALKGGLIDLIEFKIPKNDEPPYTQLNHLGIAKATMYTMNIAADYKYMKNVGVKFISAPTTRSDGTTFAIFSDLDGTYYELVQKDHKDAKIKTTHIFSLGPVNINASDFERSSAWYQMLGYKGTKKLASTDSIEVANAMGFDEKYEIDGGILTSEIDESTVELVQWITPHNPEPPYNIPANHLGIARIAFETSNIVADVAALKAQGVEFISDITPCCMGPDSTGSIVAFYDPDGAIIELAQQGFVPKMEMMWWWMKDRTVSWVKKLTGLKKMVSEETINALVGHEFPGGEYTIKHWENFLFSECTGSKPMQNNVVHPVVLFHVPILGCKTTVTEMMELGHADGPDQVMIESYEWDWFHPIKEDVSYKATGKITEAGRRKGEMGNIYDRVQFSFDLVDPEGEPTARSVITWYYMRQRWVEKLMMAPMPFMIWMKKFFPERLRSGFESLMLKISMMGIKRMFPKKSS